MVIQADLDGLRRAFPEKQVQQRTDIIPLAAEEFPGKVRIPQLSADAEGQLVGEEEVQALSALPGETALKHAEESLGDLPAGVRMHGITGIGLCFRIDDRELAVTGRRQADLPRITGRIRRNNCFLCADHAAQRLAGQCQTNRIPTLNRLTMLLQQLPAQLRAAAQNPVGKISLPRRIQRIVTQADRHAALLCIFQEPAEQRPPCLGKQRRIALVRQSSIGPP